MELPRHAFEVHVSIGGDDWEYVRRALAELEQMVNDRKPEEVGCSSGGGGGCHSIDVQIRNVTPEQFHKELEEWRQEQVRSAAQSRG